VLELAELRRQVEELALRMVAGEPGAMTAAAWRPYARPHPSTRTAGSSCKEGRVCPNWPLP